MRMRRTLLPMAALCCLPIAAQAGPMDKAMQKLDPEERAHQACSIKGVDADQADLTDRTDPLPCIRDPMRMEP